MLDGPKLITINVSHEITRELNYFNIDAIIDMANDVQHKDTPFFSDCGSMM